MIDYIMQNLWQMWAVVAVICLILELTAGDFFIICFAIGAVGAAIDAGLLGNGIYAQLFVFVVITLLSLFSCLCLWLLHCSVCSMFVHLPNAIFIRARISA